MRRNEASERGGNGRAAGTRRRRVLGQGTGYQVHVYDVGAGLRSPAVLREGSAEADADEGGAEPIRVDAEGGEEAVGAVEDAGGVWHSEHGASGA